MLLVTRFGALLILNVPFSSFRLSSGCRLELTLAITPTSSSVPDERASACSNGKPLVAVAYSSSGDFSDTASDRLDGSSEGGLTPLGYANAAKRYGRGIKSAVRASGSSSQDLDSVLVVVLLIVAGGSYEETGGGGTCAGDSCIGDTGEKPYFSTAGVFLAGERPRSDSPRARPFGLPFENGFSV